MISGIYKGKKLEYQIDGTRPTMDRVKESLFALINPYIKDSVVLDLFAGSGSLGIEALSNGASMCYFVDKNIKAINIINKNLTNVTGYKVINDDAFNAIKSFKIKFDVILLDPPYHDGIMINILDEIIKCDLLNEDGIIVCETDFDFDYNLNLIKDKKYGEKRIKVFKND